jgi:hypothetical protein
MDNGDVKCHTISDALQYLQELVLGDRPTAIPIRDLEHPLNLSGTEHQGGPFSQSPEVIDCHEALALLVEIGVELLAVVREGRVISRHVHEVLEPKRLLAAGHLGQPGPHQPAVLGVQCHTGQNRLDLGDRHLPCFLVVEKVEPVLDLGDLLGGQAQVLVLLGVGLLCLWGRDWGWAWAALCFLGASPWGRV